MKRGDKMLIPYEELKWQTADNFDYLLWIGEKVIKLVNNGGTVTEEDKSELESYVSRLTTD